MHAESKSSKERSKDKRERGCLNLKLGMIESREESRELQREDEEIEEASNRKLII